MKNKILFVLLQVMIASWAFCNESVNLQQTHSNIFKIANIERFPSSFVSQQVMQQAYEKLGINIEIIDLPAKTAIERSNAGMLQAELARINHVDQFYPNLIKVPVPINRLNGIVLTKDTQQKEYRINDIRDLKIGIFRGDVYSKNATQGMKVFEVSDISQMIKMLQTDRIDVALTNEMNALAYLAKFPAKDVRVQPSVIKGVELFHYLHVDQQYLLEPLTNVLLTMQQQGEIELLRSRYVTYLRQQAYGEETE